MTSTTRSIRAAVVLFTALTALATAMPASALSQCDPNDFTVGGVFNLNGYLACGAGSGGLPATGSNHTMQLVAIAIGLIIIGTAFVVTTMRRDDAAA